MTHIHCSIHTQHVYFYNIYSLGVFIIFAESICGSHSQFLSSFEQLTGPNRFFGHDQKNFRFLTCKPMHQ